MEYTITITMKVEANDAESAAHLAWHLLTNESEGNENVMQVMNEETEEENHFDVLDLL